MSTETVAIIGPGAVGTLLAAGLLRAGVPVALVCRNAGALQRLRKEGLFLKKHPTKGPRVRGLPSRMRPSRFCSLKAGPGRLGPCRAVFFCVKGHDTPLAIRSARNLVGPRTAVVSLQNGLAHRPALLRAFGARRTVFGAGYFAATRTAVNHVEYAGGNRVDLARHEGNAAALRTARALLSGSGWKVRTLPQEERLLWTKLILNAAINPLGALAGVSNGRIAESAPLSELMDKALEEASATAGRLGIRPLVRDLKGHARRLCRETSSNANSMLQDLAAGRRTEADSILKPVLAAAKSARVPAPTLDALHRFVRGLENSNE